MHAQLEGLNPTFHDLVFIRGYEKLRKDVTFMKETGLIQMICLYRLWVFEEGVPLARLLQADSAQARAESGPAEVGNVANLANDTEFSEASPDFFFNNCIFFHLQVVSYCQVTMVIIPSNSKYSL